MCIRDREDVVPMPVSAMLPGGRTVEVIPANSAVPCAKRLDISAVPAWDAPIPILLIESTDRTSVERETLGTVSVPPEWRKQEMNGNPALELHMGQDFVLTAKLVSSSGQTFNAPITDPRGPRI